MRELTLDQWIIVSFLFGSLFLALIIGLLSLLHKTRYLKHWVLFWFILSIAYLFLFIGYYFNVLTWVGVFFLLLPVSAYFLYRGNLRYLSKSLTVKSNVVLLGIVLSIPLLGILDTSGNLAFMFVFFTTMIYMLYTVPGLLKNQLAVDRLYGLSIAAIAILNGVFPVLMMLNFSPELLNFIVGFIGLTMAMLMVFAHYQTQQAEFITKQNELYYKSYHDNLTNLYNRAYLEDAFRLLDDDESALPISVIVADLNKLKIINDTYGHDFGDKMLQSIAKIFNDFCDSEDIIVRYGGDEFVIVLPRTTYQEAQGLASSIEKRTRNIRIEDIPLDVAIGIATKQTLNQPLHQMFVEAEKKMYQKK